MLAGPDASKTSRKPEIVADAAYAIMCKDSKKFTGKFLIDEEILRDEGVTDMIQYACDPSMNKQRFSIHTTFIFLSKLFK